METIQHIHHISAIVGNVHENVAFYRQVLNLHLVKQTVNYDDPSTYHIYFANQKAENGSLITFFPWENSQDGQKGSGQVGRIGFRIPKGSLKHWEEVLSQHQVTYTQESWGNLKALFFHDPHAVDLALVESDEVADTPEIISFHGSYLLSNDYKGSRDFLLHYMDLEELPEGDDFYQFHTKGSLRHHIILPKYNYLRGVLGPGTVHHIAWNVTDLDSLTDYKTQLDAAGFNVTSIRNRNYFKSIYLRETGKVIFEFATQGPGMTIDEDLEHLGQKLQLPPMYEKRRQEIESNLEPLKGL
ncbi:VOC family protein [Streptococcus uberis]|uniref:VOC family protein n=1 Tax=Streptococcus uberis TaxID=1349 RepID=UPI002FECC296